MAWFGSGLSSNATSEAASETELINNKIDTARMLFNVPASLMQAEVEGIYGKTLLQELGEILKYYAVYQHGADFVPDIAKDYVPSQLRYKKAASLINKEARFMFSNPPDFTVSTPYTPDMNEEEITSLKDANTVQQNLVDSVLKKNLFFKKLVQAARDCFIGKRIAYMLNFNDTGITVSFVPACGFVYKVNDSDENVIDKLVCFFTTVDSQNKLEQRIFKKKYEMKDDGFCHVTEATYDGSGNIVKQGLNDVKTLFTRIPGGVITNDGLTGDIDGESDIATVSDYESQFSKMSNADTDSIRKNMNPVRYTVDMDEESTKNLPISPGAYWDLSSSEDSNGDSGVSSKVGVLECQGTYSTALSNHLDRLTETMYNQLDIPDTSADALKGVVSSGKTLKALYWPLTTRCNEKMLSWTPALEDIAILIIEGSKLYPESAKQYIKDKIPDIEYEVTVASNYALPEDIDEEKTTDLSEVNAQTMSKKAYMMKWRNLTDTEADDELAQIVLEKEMLEDGSGMPPTNSNLDQGNSTGEEEEINTEDSQGSEDQKQEGSEDGGSDDNQEQNQDDNKGENQATK